MDTAEYMFKGGRYFYAVFMCHLSIEKALKGLYLLKLRKIPPKTHSLVYLLDSMGIKPPEDIGKLVLRLNDANVATRYPEEMAALQKAYTKPIARELLDKGRKDAEMDKDEVLTIIDIFAKALESNGIRISRIVLFGSYATGRQHEGSDIDLIVVSDDFADRGYWERVDVLAEAIYEVWKPIEARAMTVEEWERGDSMIAEFARDGELVYGERI